MSDFKSKFILQLIIDILVLGILFTVLFRILAAVFCNAAEGTAVCLPIVLCTLLANVFAAGIAVFLTQNTLSNYFDFCLKEQRLPLENRSNFKRAVDLTWRD